MMEASFFAMGPFEILIMMAMSGGGSVDLVSMTPTQDYFKSRNIEVTLPRMMELAATRPTDGKTQFAQLMALRYLAEEADGKKAEPAQIKLLEEIAAGKKAFDGPGFAKHYAARVLARWNGAKPPTPDVKASRDDAFAWFPSDVTLIGALDGRQGDAKPDAKRDSKPAILEIFKKLNPNQKDQVFSFLESVGNVQIDRVSFGYSSKSGQIFVRASGKFQTRWLAEKLAKEARMEREIVPSGKEDEDVHIVSNKNRPPVFAFVDGALCGTDILLVGMERFDGDHKGLVKIVMDVRTGKSPSVLKGDLKTEMKNVSEKAVGFLVGEVPPALQQEGKRDLGAMPTRVLGTLERGDKGMEFKLDGMMENGDAATAFVKGISAVRDRALQELKNLPPDLPFANAKQLAGVMESLQIEAKDGTAKMRVHVPNEVLRSIPAMMLYSVGGVDQLPPEKEVDPKDDKAGDKVKASVPADVPLIVSASGESARVQGAGGDKGGDPKPAFTLPKDAKAVVLSYDPGAGGFVRKGAAPYLKIQADGQVTVTSLFDGSKKEAKLTAKELDALVRFVIVDNDFFKINEAQIMKEIADEVKKTGKGIAVGGAGTSVINVQTSDKKHEVSYRAAGAFSQAYPNIRILAQFAAIEKKLSEYGSSVEKAK